VSATTTVRHESELGRWEMAIAPPAPHLRGLVTRYCGYAEYAPLPRRRVEVPTGDATLIVSLGPTLDVAYPARSPQPETFGSFVAGMHETWATTEFYGWQEGLDVKLTPLALHMLAGVAMHELANRIVRLEDLLGGETELLVERLAGAPSWNERFALLDAALTRRLEDAPRPSPSVVWAWQRLRQTDGRIAVGALAAELGCSRRNLVREFRDQVGLPPKRMARILRFNRARRLLEHDDGARLAEIGQDCGYYDQPHLNREFREFAGASPTDFLARRLPDGAGVSAPV
jgi:AraC-like DNA-binding protein